VRAGNAPRVHLDLLLVEVGRVLDEADVLQHVVLEPREQQLLPHQLLLEQQLDERRVLLLRLGLVAVRLELEAVEPEDVGEVRLHGRQHRGGHLRSRMWSWQAGESSTSAPEHSSRHWRQQRPQALAAAREGVLAAAWLAGLVGPLGGGGSSDGCGRSRAELSRAGERGREQTCLLLFGEQVAQVLRADLLAGDGAAEVVQQDLERVWRGRLCRRCCALAQRRAAAAKRRPPNRIASATSRLTLDCCR
jgi:hypothetical protein